MGVSGIDVAGIVGGALSAHEAGTVIEHVTAAGHRSRGPFVAHIDGLQLGAVGEHKVCSDRLFQAEAGEVDCFQVAAVVEHARHAVRTRDVGRVEIAQVKTFQAAAVFKHPMHISHFGRVEMAQVETCQASAFIE